MAEDSALNLNGIDVIPEIKTEPVDPLLVDIPRDLIHNRLNDDPDCDDVLYFTAAEVESTRRCLENTKLIIKDFETQLDWHLQQYITLLKGGTEGNKKQDFLTLPILGSIIATHPECNKNFIKPQTPVMNGRKRKVCNDETSDSDDESFEHSDCFPTTSAYVTAETWKEPKTERTSDDEEKAQSSQTQSSKNNAHFNSVEKSKQGSSGVEVENEQVDRDIWTDLLKSKTINALEELYIDFKKPVIILKSEDVEQFDVKDCLSSNVIITCDSNNVLPEFVFSKNIATYIVNGFIKLVQTDVFDHYLSEQTH